jgi:hypothetical protein
MRSEIENPATTTNTLFFFYFKHSNTMILDNAKPRLEDAVFKANVTKRPQDVAFIYNELLTHDTIISVFDWLFKEGVDFATRRDEFRFVVIVQPPII